MRGDQRPGFAKFETTQWSAAFQAQATESGVRREAVADLIRRYYPALLAHLMRKQWIDYERASDLVQGFVADKLLEKRLVRRAEPGKGKFRSLLVRALENYAIDELRKGAHNQALKALEFEPLAEPSTDAFDIACVTR